MTGKLKKIHDTALRILSEIGIKLFHPEVLDIVQQKGARRCGKTIFFRPEQVMAWVRKAPGRFTLHARNPKYNVVIGDDHTECAAGYGCAQIIMDDGTRRDAVLKDYVSFAKLVHQSDHFKINGGILAQPSDIPADRSHLIMLYAAATHSDKCLLGVPGDGQKMQEIMDLMAVIFGGKQAFIQKPRILTLINPISPLQIDEMGLQSMLIAAKHGQGLIISPGPASGTTGPISLAGNLALATAEALAGIVIAQMIAEGTPVLFGLQATGADLKTGNISVGSPALALQANYCAALARMYGLPSRGGGTPNDAKGVSVQSGYESMMSMLIAYQSQINLILHSAGILDSYAGMSFEQFFVDLEIIRMIQYYVQDIAVGADALSFDLIKNVGPGGQFLTTADTLEKCRTHSWVANIGIQEHRSDKTPNDELLEIIQIKIQHMLDSYQKPELDGNIQEKLDNYMEQVGVARKILDAISGNSQKNAFSLLENEAS